LSRIRRDDPDVADIDVQFFGSDLAERSQNALAKCE
jgi:hypothetical protein